MTIFFDAPVSPADQTVFAREVPIPAGLVLSNLFPSVEVDAVRVNLSEIAKKNRAARFRAPDGRIHVADRDGATDKVINMLPLSDSRNQGEYETLQRDMARLGGTRSEALEAAIYNDTEDLTRYVRNRAELAFGDVLVDGKFTPNLYDEFAGVEIDFGVPASNLTTLAGAAQWTDANVATADGLSALTAACDAIEASCGQRPTWALSGRTNVRKLEAQTKVINAVAGAQTGRTNVALSDMFNTFASKGIPTDWRIVETVIDVDGVATRVIPDNVVVLGAGDFSDVLEFRYGVTATAMELVDSNRVDFSYQSAPGIVGVVVKGGPPFRQFTFVDAIGLPFLKDSKRIGTVTVR